MKRFVEGEDRRQATLLPECLDDYVTDDNPLRIVEAFIDELDLAALGFAGIVPEMTGRPSYRPTTLLKIYIYGYLNRIQSIRRLERETQRNLEMMWLAGRLMPDFKTIADFRRDNGPAIRAACAQFVGLRRHFSGADQSGSLPQFHSRSLEPSDRQGRVNHKPCKYGTGLRQESIWRSPSMEIACPEMVRPRGEHRKTIWSASCCAVTYCLSEALASAACSISSKETPCCCALASSTRR